MPAKNRITAIGLELEGAWDVPPRNLKRDGSISGNFGPAAVGEVASAPISNVLDAEHWIRSHYPQHVNNTCGFHVHISLAPLYYSRLMVEDFNLKFLSAMEDFYHRFRGQEGFDLFRERLDGQNRFCQKRFVPEQQLWRTEAYGDHNLLPRYSQLNYCFGRHGTLECRLFPCFPLAEHAVGAMKAFVNVVNDFLATSKSERTIRFSVPVPTDEPISCATASSVSNPA